MPFSGFSSNSVQGASTVRVPTLLPEKPDHTYAITQIDAISNTFIDTTTSSSFQTALTVGATIPQAGVLTMAAIWTGTAAVSPGFRITLDGKVVYNKTAALAQNNIRVAAGIFGSDGAGPPTLVTAGQTELPFEKSCLVEFVSSGGNTTECYYDYYETES